jgi:hypothetical protein
MRHSPLFKWPLREYKTDDNSSGQYQGYWVSSEAYGSNEPCDIGGPASGLPLVNNLGQTATPIPSLTPSVTPTLTLTPTPTVTPTGTWYTATPTVTPTIDPNLSWPVPSHLSNPSAPLPRISINPSAEECVYHSGEGRDRRACAIRAYNAVWDYLHSQGTPMTWDIFFTITLHGEAAILYIVQPPDIIKECGEWLDGEPGGETKVSGPDCWESDTYDQIRGYLERAFIRQITEVCAIQDESDHQPGCTQDEFITLLGGLNVAAEQQKFGIEAWYNAGRTSETDGNVNLTKLLGIPNSRWQNVGYPLSYWQQLYISGGDPERTGNFGNGCGQLACSWGNHRYWPSSFKRVAWVVYYNFVPDPANSYNLIDPPYYDEDHALFIVGEPQ